VLVSHGVDPKDILVAKGEYLDIPTVNLEERVIPSNILEYIPEETAKHYKFVPLDYVDSTLHIGVVDPDNIEARDALQFIASRLAIPYKIFLITEEDYAKAIEMYKGLSGEVTKALTELETELSGEKQQQEKKANIQEEIRIATVGADKFTEEAPVVKIVTNIIRYAIDGGASDVHIEPMADKIRVRYRVDGILNTSITLPNHVQSAVVARIKVVSNMKLDEKRLPQDGRFSVKVDKRKVDFRVSTFPTNYGEKVEMRILDQEKAHRTLDNMGYSPEGLAMIRAAIKKPYGLILITGPTGSGKSTTLYGMLQEMDRDTDNILSLEDPIEYNIDGVSQSQVKPEIGYTFANGLRTTLRQDPDVIMVGEIRDKETAQLAIQAALTGHLVLSTLHTNSAAGAIPRLIDMGVDPYLIAPTLVCAMAQRLVLTLAPGSGKEIPVDGAIKVMIEKQFEDLPAEYKNKVKIGTSVYTPTPTADCPSGVKGRVAVMEGFLMDKDIERVILKDPNELSISKLLRQKGMLSIREDALIKAFDKKIPFEEVNKL
jgi:type IV pilus assembly protein PilB